MCGTAVKHTAVHARSSGGYDRVVRVPTIGQLAGRSFVRSALGRPVPALALSFAAPMTDTALSGTGTPCRWHWLAKPGLIGFSNQNAERRCALSCQLHIVHSVLCFNTVMPFLACRKNHRGAERGTMPAALLQEAAQMQASTATGVAACFCQHSSCWRCPYTCSVVLCAST